jgi:peptide/nickel transport system permease protein
MKRSLTGFGLLMIMMILTVPYWGDSLGLDPYGLAPDFAYAAASASHWLGTDELGRDVFARILYGGRVSLSVALISTLCATVIGLCIGLVAGYFGGWCDLLLMRVTDMVAVLPRLPVMMFLLALDEQLFGASNPSLVRLIVVMAGFGWMSIARLARAATLQARNAPFVEAARACGTPPNKIVLRHILTQAAVPVAVAASIDLGQAVIYENVLSFLGLGVMPPQPSWGAMLNQGLSYLHQAPLLALIPGLLTFAFVAWAHFLSEHLRVALDPRSFAR